MNREEAVAYFEGWHLSPNAEDLYVNVRVNVGKMRAAIAAMTCPWVRTADRLPEGKDAFEDKVLVYNYVEKRQQLKLWLTVRTYPHVFPYWMPIPSLPEVENEL